MRRRARGGILYHDTITTIGLARTGWLGYLLSLWARVPLRRGVVHWGSIFRLFFRQNSLAVEPILVSRRDKPICQEAIYRRDTLLLAFNMFTWFVKFLELETWVSLCIPRTKSCHS